MLVRSVAAFVTRPRLRLDHGPPPRPPWRRGYGSYCLKATCHMWDEDGNLAGKVVGYDRYMHIQDSVQNACRLNARDMDGVTCGSAHLTLLSDYRKECAGEVYFVLDGTWRKLL